jgi:flagella basal body P-ring formation protein FlgA
MEWRFVMILTVAMWFITDAHAQTGPTADPSKMLRMYLDSETTGLPGRVEVTVSAIDERLRLAPCAHMVPFLPPGARLWGRSLIGVRCQDSGTPGAGWSVLVPVEIKVFGQALVATRSMTAGETPGLDSLALQEIELTREPPGALVDPAVIGESVLTRPLTAGQTLRRDYLRARPVVTAGDMVKLVANGSGFSITSYGKALSGAADGQTVRVQTESGRTMSGVARSGKVVEIGL